jgi:hypothetical protein
MLELCLGMLAASLPCLKPLFIRIFRMMKVALCSTGDDESTIVLRKAPTIRDRRSPEEQDAPRHPYARSLAEEMNERDMSGYDVDAAMLRWMKEEGKTDIGLLPVPAVTRPDLAHTV